MKLMQTLIVLPTKHVGVVKDSFKRVRAFQIELECESVGFSGEGKNMVPREKPLGVRERTKKILQKVCKFTFAGLTSILTHFKI